MLSDIHRCSLDIRKTLSYFIIIIQTSIEPDVFSTVNLLLLMKMISSMQQIHVFPVLPLARILDFAVSLALL